MNLDDRKQLARDVLAGLNDLDPGALRMLAAGLSLAAGPLRELAQPFRYYADVLEYEEVEGWLAVLAMAHALDRMDRDPECGELIERLEDMEGPPWPQLREALETLRTAREP
jgi:hypothetical protein